MHHREGADHPGPAPVRAVPERARPGPIRRGRPAQPGLFPLGPWWLDLAILAGCVLIVIRLTLRLFDFRCPVCDGLFFVEDTGSGFFAERCRHCGLKLDPGR